MYTRVLQPQSWVHVHVFIYDPCTCNFMISGSMSSEHHSRSNDVETYEMINDES